MLRCATFAQGSDESADVPALAESSAAALLSASAVSAAAPLSVVVWELLFPQAARPVTIVAASKIATNFFSYSTLFPFVNCSFILISAHLQSKNRILLNMLINL